MKKINKKKPAWMLYYGWFDGMSVHGVFTDKKEAEFHLDILQAKEQKEIKDVRRDTDDPNYRADPEFAKTRYFIKEFKLNKFYKYHLKDVI